MPKIDQIVTQWIFVLILVKKDNDMQASCQLIVNWNESARTWAILTRKTKNPFEYGCILWTYLHFAYRLKGNDKGKLRILWTQRTIDEQITKVINVLDDTDEGTDSYAVNVREFPVPTI